jgi:hypothetical protein
LIEYVQGKPSERFSFLLKNTNWLKETFSISDYDRERYIERRTWILSIGINDYDGEKYRNSITDAERVGTFFEQQAHLHSSRSAVTKWVLTGASATRDSILACLNYVIAHATAKDNFVFLFSGFSTAPSLDKRVNEIAFAPHGIRLLSGHRLNAPGVPSDSLMSKLIPLSLFQQKLQLIPAVNQIIITEAGPSETFRQEFIKASLQGSPDIAAILNTNRVVLVPTGFGFDGFLCKGEHIQQGPLAHYITSLEPNDPENHKDRFNIFQLFDSTRKDRIVYQLKKREFECGAPFGKEYFNVFFQRDAIAEYKFYSGGNEGVSRGAQVEGAAELQRLYPTKKHALVIGTDEYAGGWRRLNNAVYDAESVAEELEKDYGFTVKLLSNPPLDSIYAALYGYYNSLDSSGQLFVYIAGHGDLVNNLMQQGYVVCASSKSKKEDPYHRTYLPLSELHSLVNRQHAKQVMLVLDICHAGTLDPNLLGVGEGQSRSDQLPDANTLKLSVQNRLREYAQYSTRAFLASVGETEAQDGAPGRHSPFARMFLNCLRGRGSGTDGVLTNTHLHSQLDALSIADENGYQIKPHHRDFASGQGRFVFIPLEKAEVAVED